MYRHRDTQGGESYLQFQNASGHYKNFMKMTPSVFEFLLNEIGAKIKK